MKLYAVGGLGADERVFSHLDLIFPILPLEWVTPNGDEEFDSYCLRISEQIDPTSSFGIIGVSFGGLVAIELNKILNPKFTVLISSVSKSNELPKWRWLGNLGLLNLVPDSLMKPPQFIFNYLFGARNKSLLKDIITDTDPQFIKWALNAIVLWQSDWQPENLHRIHGTNDKLIPLKGQADIVKDGGHFMIVDHADTISEKINFIITDYK